MTPQSSCCYSAPLLETFVEDARKLDQTAKISAGSTSQTKPKRSAQKYKNSLKAKDCNSNSFHSKAARFLNHHHHPCFQLCHKRQQIKQLLEGNKGSFMQKMMVHKALDAKILSCNLCSSCFQKKHSCTQPWG